MQLKVILDRIKNYFDFPFKRFIGTSFKINDRYEREYFIFKINFDKQLIEEYNPHIDEVIDMIEEKDIASYFSELFDNNIVMITNNNYFDDLPILSLIETSTHIYGLKSSISPVDIENNQYKVYRTTNDIDIYFDMFMNRIYGTQNKRNKYIIHKIFGINDKRNKDFNHNIKNLFNMSLIH